MKKIYLSIALCGITFTGLYAQRANNDLNVPQPANLKAVKGVKPTSSALNIAKSIIWNEDFDIGTSGPASTPGPTFTTGNGVWTTGGVDGNIWKHNYYTSSGEWSFNTPDFESPTYTNGFMLFDSDSVNLAVAQGNQSLYAGYTGELISPSIDLSSEPSAMLVLHQDFRYCCSATHNLQVSVSTDGGISWGAPYDLTMGFGANDNYQNSNGDDTEAVVNISDQAAFSTIMLKFTWDGVASGNSHYFWALDDICIVEWPTDDLQMMSSWIVGENNEGVEYGRTPEDHVDANYTIGSELYNFGSGDQTNIVWDADFNGSTFTTSGMQALLESDSTTIIENLEPVTLTTGLYAGDYTADSDQETSGTYYMNNTGVREFEVTPPTTSTNSIYSQDGLDVYTDPIISSIGTSSFPDGDDGLVLATMYHIKQTATISGIRVMLSGSTVPGGEVYGSLKDTATFINDDMTSLFSTSPVTISAADTAVGYIDLMFPAGTTLDAGAYYAAIELYSFGGTNEIRVLDDETVFQPFWASAIYIPGDQSYTNGTATAVRLLMGESWLSVGENTLEGVSVYPNPSEGVLNISNDNGTENTITVHDLAGKLILTTTTSMSTTIDLTGNGTGVYLVEVSSATGSMVERVVIK